MPGPEVAVRLAVRSGLRDLPAGTLVGVAVSGGADSLTLLHATVAVAPALRVRVAALTVDHGWHHASAEVAARVAASARAAGCVTAEVLRVDPAVTGTGGEGPEGEARRARYALLDAATERLGCEAVLLGHTLDDQAETVLLALARGSGARSLSGMVARRGRYRRPLLGLRRSHVHAALAVLAPDLPDGLPWDDPANHDHRYARARVRDGALPAVAQALGPGAVESLARSADLLRADADALDAWAAGVVAELHEVRSGPAPAAVDVDTTRLRELPVAVASRALRLLAARAGASPLSAAHTDALRALVRAAPGSGAGPVGLPGGIAASRSRGRLRIGPTGNPAPADTTTGAERAATDEET